MHLCIHVLIHINTYKHKSLKNAEGPEVMLGRERLKALESLKQEDEFKASFSYITSPRPTQVGYRRFSLTLQHVQEEKEK